MWFQEKRHQKNCCPEVLLPLSSSEGACWFYTLKWSSCFIFPPHWNIPLVQFMAVELAQDDACYGRMQVSRGKQVEWQYGGKSVVKLLELAIWCRVWCLLRTVCHLSISKDCFLFQFELDTSKVKANWDSVLLQANIPPAYKWSIIGESESDNLV